MMAHQKKKEKWVFRFLIHPFLSLLLFSSIGNPAQSQPFGEWKKIIVNQDYHTPLVLDEGDDNTLIVGAVFHDFTGDAITLGNVTNVYIKNCVIYGIDGNGIVLRSTRKTDKVTIDGCVIHDTTKNGIIAKQNIDEGVDHTQLVIKNNTLYNNGTTELDHGLYIQAQDTRIENNEITGSSGNGISIRSSGVVSGNIIRDSNKSCIRYFSDNARGPSDTLLVENNVCTVSSVESLVPALSLLVADNTPPDWIVGNYIIRFNTIAVFTGKREGIAVESNELESKNIMVYGNIVINTQDPHATIRDENIDYYSSNYVSTELEGFVDIQHPPYDLHLTPWSPAADYASRETGFPVYDADGKLRFAGDLDAGAYQLTRNAFTFVVQSASYLFETLFLIGVSYLCIKGIKNIRRRNRA